MNPSSSLRKSSTSRSDDRFISEQLLPPMRPRELIEKERKTDQVGRANLTATNPATGWLQRSINAAKNWISPKFKQFASSVESSSEASSSGSNQPPSTDEIDAERGEERTISDVEDLGVSSSDDEVEDSKRLETPPARVDGDQPGPRGTRKDPSVLCYSMMVERNRIFDRQISAKAAQLQNALESQQKLQRILGKLASLPPSLNTSQKKEVQMAIEQARANGVEWTGEPWNNEQSQNHLLEEIRIQIGEIQAGHSKEHTKLTRLSDTQHQFVQIFISIMKALHESKVRMIQAIR